MQTRNAKLTTNAQLKIGLDMYEEELITFDKLIDILKNININDSLYKKVKNNENNIIAKGISSNPGAIKVKIALTDEYIEENYQKSDLCLIRNYTSVDDYLSMTRCKAFITKIGGSTSHASVIARSLNKAAVCGVNSLEIYIKNSENKLDEEKGDLFKNYVKFDNKIFYEGDEIVVDGANGLILEKCVEIMDNTDNVTILSKLINLVEVNSNNLLQVALNADTVQEIQANLSYNIKKIGLCRTEHMLVDMEMLKIFRKYIITSLIVRKKPNFQKFFHLKDKYLQELIAIQTKKFVDILNYNLSIAIRLFDPPLHEFFQLNLVEDIAKSILEDLKNLSISKDLYNFDLTGLELNSVSQIEEKDLKIEDVEIFKLIKHIIVNLQEINPMLGNRGSRLGVDLPQIYELQIISLFESLKISQYQNITGITIPFINDLEEFLFLKNMIMKIKNQYNLTQQVQIGVMIETTRSCFISDKLAKHCDYFSFGTNDLTQMALGISRDDIQKISSKYYEFWGLDPFQDLDFCVKQLMEMSVNAAKIANPQIKFSVCGEHARFKSNIKFFKSLGIHEISVSSSAILTTKYNVLINN